MEVGEIVLAIFGVIRWRTREEAPIVPRQEAAVFARGVVASQSVVANLVIAARGDDLEAGRIDEAESRWTVAINKCADLYLIAIDESISRDHVFSVVIVVVVRREIVIRLIL